MTTLPPRIVLDASTVLGYADGMIAVGELIAEVADEGARVGVPVVCLVEAYRRVREDRLPTLALLAEHPAVDVVDTRAADWTALAGLARGRGGVEAAAALLLALTADGHVLTTAPSWYGDWKDLPIIAI